MQQASRIPLHLHAADYLPGQVLEVAPILRHARDTHAGTELHVSPLTRTGADEWDLADSNRRMLIL